MSEKHKAHKTTDLEAIAASVEELKTDGTLTGAQQEKVIALGEQVQAAIEKAKGGE